MIHDVTEPLFTGPPSASPFATTVDVLIGMVCHHGDDVAAIPIVASAVLKQALDIVSADDEVLARLRSDANSDGWAKLRQLMHPLMGWLYSDAGPSQLQRLTEIANVPMTVALSCITAHLCGDPSRVAADATCPARRVGAVGLGLPWLCGDEIRN